MWDELGGVTVTKLQHKTAQVELKSGLVDEGPAQTGLVRYHRGAHSLERIAPALAAGAQVSAVESKV